MSNNGTTVPLNFFIMTVLTNIWNNYTVEFSKLQKVVVGIVLAMIISIATFAIVLLIMEVT